MNPSLAALSSTVRPFRPGVLDARRLPALWPAAVLALVAACSTTPRVPPGNVSHLPPGNSQRDGPEANPPSDLWEVPDAVPQIEPVRIGGPNKPYEVDGHTYVPITDDRSIVERGLASWYGKKFHGRRTSSGEAYNMYAMTAAHKTLPIPSYARVRNPANGQEIIVRVNDRGPFASGRIIDLSYTAALKLGVLGGVQPVEVERITGEDIRTGAAFQRGGTRLASAAAPGTAGRVAQASSAPPATATTTVVTTTTVAALAPGNAALSRQQATALPSVAIDSRTVTDTATGATPLPAVSDAAGIGAAPGVVASMASAPSAATELPPAIAPAVGGTSPGLTTDIARASSPDFRPGMISASSPNSGIGIESASSPRTGTGIASAPSPSIGTSMASGLAVASLAPAASNSVDASPQDSPSLREESAHAETPGGAGFWVQIGAYRQRTGALDFQHRLVDEQPWLAPLLAVFSENGLSRLQAGPYGSREDARHAAERIRVALQLVPTIVQKR